MADETEQTVAAKPERGEKEERRRWPHNRRDPWVAITRRSFSFEIDREVFEPVPEGKTVAGKTVAAKPPVTLITEIGITFLCAEVSCFALMNHPLGHQAPASAGGPTFSAEIRCLTPTILQTQRYINKDRGRRYKETEAAILSAFESIGWGRGGEFSDDDIVRSRFLLAPGDTEPDVIVMRVSEIFGTTQQSRWAQAILDRLIKSAKAQVHVGALHDFAVMAEANGRSIAEKCRQRANACEWRKP